MVGFDIGADVEMRAGLHRKREGGPQRSRGDKAMRDLRRQCVLIGAVAWHLVEIASVRAEPIEDPLGGSALKILR